MKVSHKKVGLGIVAAAAVLMGSAAIADNMGMMDMAGKMGMGHMGMGQMGGMMGGFDFAAADANKDGKVTQDEFNAWRTATVEGIDTDKDGKISVDELAAMHLKQMQAAANDMATRMVKALDTDGDGKLSAAELIARPMPMDAFTMADTNKDGVVDQAEADAAAQMMQRGGDGMMGEHDGQMGGHQGRHHKGMIPGMTQGNGGGNAPADGTGGN